LNIEKDSPRWNDRSFCLDAVTEDGLLLQYVPDLNQDDEVCLAAVKKNPDALQFVRRQTPRLCRTAIERDPLALKHVRQQNEFLCRLAMEQDPLAEAYVAGEFRYLLTEREDY